jgi:hypothetical protein
MNNTIRFYCFFVVTAACFMLSFPCYASWRDILKQVEKNLGGSSSELSQEKIGKGLREALKIGAENAVKKVSVVNGYLENPEIKIPLPEKVKKIEDLLRTIGLGPQVDSFSESMNHAAEKAAPAAKDLFWEAVKGITFNDARKILKGRDNEATLYLKDKTAAKLLETFKPLVHQAMGSVGVTKQYQDLETKVKNIPFAGTSLNVDLDQYVSEKALNGLFIMLEKEEQKIRKDPAARVTELLKDVFGSNK